MKQWFPLLLAALLISPALVQANEEVPKAPPEEIIPVEGDGRLAIPLVGSDEVEKNEKEKYGF